MRSTLTQPSIFLPPIDRKIMWLLRRNGPQTLDALSALTGLDWERVFSSVDGLIRTGKVTLTLVRPREYHVSVAGPDR